MQQHQYNAETEYNILLQPEIIKSKFALQDDELLALAEFGKLYAYELNNFIDDFYKWMRELPEFSHFFPNATLVDRVKQQQTDYWKEFFTGRITSGYLSKRAHIGAVHARIGLPIYSYCTAMNYSFVWWKKIIEDYRKNLETKKKSNTATAVKVALAFHKLIQLDITIVTETYHKNVQEKLQNTLEETQTIVTDVTKVAESVVDGDFSTSLEDDGSKINQVINQMIQSLQKAATENHREKWLKTGQAEFAEHLRGDLDLATLAGKAIDYLTDYLDAKVGVFYIVTKDKKLKLIASHAYNKRKTMSNEFDIGEGMIGQAVLEKKTIILDNVPAGYLSISSGTGEATPSSIMISPIIFENNVLAVMELATFGNFDTQHLEFIELAQESMAISLMAAENRTKVNELLADSQKKSAELEQKQKEMEVINQDLKEKANALKVSEEELKTQSEELQAINEELEEKTQILEEQKRNIEKKNEELEESKKMLEVRAKQLQSSDKYKSEFLSNMSHELRTPLNSLLILAQTFATNEDGNLNEEQIKAADIIYNSGKDLLHLINDILDLSKVEAGKLVLDIQDLGMEEFLENIYYKLKPMAEKNNIQFELDISNNIPGTIRTDGIRLEQIIKNLLSNAFKFTEENGTVKFRVYTPTTEELTENGINMGDNIIAFSINDNGIGIAEEDKVTIFEAFKQSDGSISRKYGGTGLGLTISQQLANKLGGEIKLNSKIGEGSTFILYLSPASASNASISIKKDVKQQKTIKMKKTKPLVLIIEDDKNFISIMESQLKNKGFESIIAKDGQKGFELAKKHEPDAIIMDVGLPDIGGLQLLEKLKQDAVTKDIPVHVVSGADVKQPALEKGALGYIQKPLDKDQLDELVNKAAEVVKQPVKSILIVEDDDIQREALCKLLASDNVLLQVASTGKDAEQLLKKENFQCMILDLNLPDMSGYELLEKISKIKEVVLPPVIIHTAGDISEEDQKKLSEYNPTFVLKSADAPNRMTEEVALFLHKIKTPDSIVVKSQIKGLDGRKILLVDDDMRNNIALSAVLRKQGAEVVMADNGKLAIECLENHDGIDLILMDIMMPVMDGYTAMKSIRSKKKYNNLPIIALTAKAMAEDRKKCLDAGANDYLSKPIDLEKLFDMAQVWLQE